MNIDLFVGRKFSSENMGDNSTYSLPFCLTPLWDIDLTWNTDNPDFTRYSIQYLSNSLPANVMDEIQVELNAIINTFR